MRFAATIIAYNEGRYIIPAIRQYPEWVERVVVCASTRPWFGPSADTAGEMLSKLERCADPRLTVVRKAWRRERDQRDWGVAMLSGYDWVFTLDPDEFLTPEDWEKARRKLESLDASESVAIASRMTTYWKDTGHVWDEEGTHRPVVAVRPSGEGATFWEKRETVEETRMPLPVELHHLSWVRSDAEVLAKIRAYSHAVDFDTDAWYRDVWLAWKPDMYGLMPLKFPADVKAKEGELPDSVKRYLCP